MTTLPAKPVRPFTGWHMLALALGFFGVIIAVNVVMAWQAIATFPGLEVKSSYAESQNFDKVRAAQVALGWKVSPGYDRAKDQLRLSFLDRAGEPVVLKDISVLVGRPTETKEDRNPVMRMAEDGAYVADEKLPLGKWMIQIKAHAQDGTLYQARSYFYVRD
ncbi:FixH family protein [Stagnihabitans tardus]|uniref:Nitrogen fixation protein FixH n=1 Tax=Stagnihabitans tardus TaxID=2699202 RepID=A0AAE5BS16_9RHOB|nr:FixH family protein [Stagnihabitans tardus]NBZ87245.1 nitrogen fixation protein FixH [Stagnihabitans tardus]